MASWTWEHDVVWPECPLSRVTTDSFFLPLLFSQLLQLVCCESHSTAYKWHSNKAFKAQTQNGVPDCSDAQENDGDGIYLDPRFRNMAQKLALLSFTPMWHVLFTFTSADEVNSGSSRRAIVWLLSQLLVPNTLGHQYVRGQSSLSSMLMTGCTSLHWLWMILIQQWHKI